MTKILALLLLCLSLASSHAATVLATVTRTNSSALDDTNVVIMGSGAWTWALPYGVLRTNWANTSNSLSFAINIRHLGALGGTNDDTAVFQAAANRGQPIFIPNSTNYTISGIILTNNTRLISDGATINFLSTASGYAIDTGLGTNWTIQGLVLRGGQTAPPASAGTRHGIMATTDTGGTLRDVKVFGFDGNGVQLSANTADSFDIIRSRFDSVNVALCYYGLIPYSYSSSQMSEYVAISGFNIQNCTYGAYIGAGNIVFGNSIITGCTNGIYVGGGYNEAHGIVDGVAINHCDRPIWVDTIANGHAFNGCTIFASKSGGTPVIKIDSSQGVIVQGCTIGTAIVISDGASTYYTNGGNWIINNTVQSLTLQSTNSGRIEEYGNVIVAGNADVDSSTRNVGLWRAYDAKANLPVEFGNWGFGYMGLWLGMPITNGITNFTLMNRYTGITYLNAADSFYGTIGGVNYPWIVAYPDRGIIAGEFTANTNTPGKYNWRLNGSLTVHTNLTVSGNQTNKANIYADGEVVSIRSSSGVVKAQSTANAFSGVYVQNSVDAHAIGIEAGTGDAFLQMGGGHVGWRLRRADRVLVVTNFLELNKLTATNSIILSSNITSTTGPAGITNGLSAFWNSNGVATYLRAGPAGYTTNKDFLITAH